ncbi:MAG TPA: alpha/beta-hydrolase family protein [Candidatus Nanopelagicales bacterium]|jgi:uncharacterized membrane protein|nr:alpha/beta-hydrolase family protein [Candidatus Nanopelagicales bacterium]
MTDWDAAMATSGRGIALVVAASSVPRTFAGSLSARTWRDQGMITALSAGTGYLLTVVANDVLEVAGELLEQRLPLPSGMSPGRRRELATLLAQLAVVPVAAGVAAALPRRPGEPLRRGLARQAAWRLGVTGVGGATLVVGRVVTATAAARTGRPGLARVPLGIPLGLAVAAAADRVRRRGAESATDAEQLDPLTRGNPVLGLAAAAAATGVVTAVAVAEGTLVHRVALGASRRLPGGPAAWRLALHGTALGGAALGVSRLWGMAMHRIEAGTSGFEEGLDATAAGRWTTPNTSGDPASLVSWDGLGREGRRHAVAAVRTERSTDRMPGMPDTDLSIPAVMGTDAVAEPVQVYVGLDNAPTETARVELALAELDRTGGWDRSLLMLISPTGTGYVNYVAVAAVQYLTLGDVATVTMQYSKRPSPLSLGKVSEAREQNRLLWLRIAERVRDLPVDSRPRVVLFGESLGAHTSQDAFLHWGTLGPQSLGIERGLWIGTPYASGWKDQVTGDPRPDVDPALVTMVNDFGQVAAMDADRRGSLRYVLLSHDNDGVTKFGSDLLVTEPNWLGPDRPRVELVPPASPRGVPSAMRWQPLTTFFQSLVDMKNAQLPGAYRAWAHDYRADLPEFLREVYGLSATDEQLARVADAVRIREQIREKVMP